MSFTEKSTLKDERRPLLRDPVWHNNYRYGMGRGRRHGDDEDHMEELLGLDHHKHQRFRWIVFLCVTFLSILVMLGTMGVLIKLAQTNNSTIPSGVHSTTTQMPIKTSSQPIPTSPSSLSTPPTSISSPPSTAAAATDPVTSGSV